MFIFISLYAGMLSAMAVFIFRSTDPKILEISSVSPSCYISGQNEWRKSQPETENILHSFEYISMLISLYK